MATIEYYHTNKEKGKKYGYYVIVGILTVWMLGLHISKAIIDSDLSDLEEEYRQIVLIVTYWHYLTSAYGFNMIQTPIIEDSEVINKVLIKKVLTTH